MSTIQNIANSVPRLFLLAELAIGRCIAFTDGSEAESLVSLLTNVFHDYMDHLYQLLKYLRIIAHLDPGDSKPEEVRLAQATDDDFHDWKENYFQGALQLLEIVSKLTSRLNNFDKSLRTSLVKQKAILFGNGDLNNLNDFSNIPCLHLAEEPDKAKKLYRFLQISEDVAYKVLSSSAELYRSFHSATQALVFDSMFSYIKEKLECVPSLEEWSKEQDSKVLSFSLSPQSYVKLVVEHLLVLPQLLEQAEQQQLPSPDPIPILQDSNIDEFDFYMEESNEEGKPEQGAEQKEQTQTKSQGFAVEWISLVARATMSLYLQKIFEIKKLSEFGATQLAVDINHLFTFVSMLGEPDKALQKVLEFLEAPQKTFKEKLLEAGSGSAVKIGRLIGMMRGILIPENLQ